MKEVQWEKYKQQADQLRNKFDVHVLMVYYRGYVISFMKKKYKDIMIHRCTQEEQGTRQQVSLKNMKDDAQVRTRIDDCILMQ